VTGTASNFVAHWLDSLAGGHALILGDFDCIASAGCGRGPLLFEAARLVGISAKTIQRQARERG
jgi:hypothetical protein